MVVGEMLLDDTAAGGRGVVVGNSPSSSSSSDNGNNNIFLNLPFDDNPYETLPSNTRAATHMMAGAAAGLLEHTIMYPIDCVKVIVLMFFLHPHFTLNYFFK